MSHIITEEEVVTYSVETKGLVPDSYYNIQIYANLSAVPQQSIEFQTQCPTERSILFNNGPYFLFSGDAFTITAGN